MNTKGYGNIPSTLYECITFIARALPVRSVPTFIELLVGAMITQAGFVTEAWLAINPVRSWNAYYKWLQHGKWSWVALGVQMARLMVTCFPQPIWFIIFDDTFIYRCSKKAPGSAIHHQHGNKTNRPQYARGQCWVTMALSISAGMKHSAIPLLSRLMQTTGNSTKLDTAKVLLRVIAPVFAGQKVITLVDSWFMKWPYLKYVLHLGFNAIGQVRYDTALFGIPVFTGKRGRPRKYGDKFTPEVVAALPVTRERIFLYSKWQWVHYRSAVCLARFMKGHKVRVIWMQFEDKNGKLSKQRLILSTLCNLMPQQIFVYYARRWSIEDLFNQMKNRWGWKVSWQQSRLVLHRWTQILSIAYALPQILATYCGEQVQNLMHITPWRRKNPVTAGRIRLGLQMILGNVRVREWWNPKYRIFKPPNRSDPPVGKQDTAENQYSFMSKNNLADFHPPPS
jgi:DDE superfamily endonuclease